MVTNFILPYSRLEKFDDVGQIFKLIRLFRGNECLWNLNSAGYNNLTMRENAWNRINRLFGGEFTIDQVKLQMKSLREYYHTERAIMAESALCGNDYVPRHSYYYELEFLNLTTPLDESIVASSNLNEEQKNCLAEQQLKFSTSTLFEPRTSSEDMHSIKKNPSDVPCGMRTDDLFRSMADRQETISLNTIFDSVLPNTVSLVSFLQPTAPPHCRASSGGETYVTQSNRYNNAHYKLCIVDNKCINPVKLRSRKLYSGDVDSIPKIQCCQEAVARLQQGQGNTSGVHSAPGEVGICKTSFNNSNSAAQALDECHVVSKNIQEQQEKTRTKENDMRPITMKYFNHKKDLDMQCRQPSMQPLQLYNSVATEKCKDTHSSSYGSALHCDGIFYGALPKNNIENWPDTRFDGKGVMLDCVCAKRTESMKTPKKNVSNMTTLSTNNDTQVNRFVTQEELLACRNYIGNQSDRSKYDIVDQYYIKVCTSRRSTKVSGGRSQMRDKVASLVKGRSKERSQSAGQTYNKSEEESKSGNALNGRSNSVKDIRRNRPILDPRSTRTLTKQTCEYNIEPTMQRKIDHSLLLKSKNKKKLMNRTANSHSTLQSWSHSNSQERETRSWKTFYNVLSCQLSKIKDHHELERQAQELQKRERYKQEQQEQNRNEHEVRERQRQSLTNNNHRPRGPYPNELKEYDACECEDDVSDEGDAEFYEYEHKSDKSIKVVIVKPKIKKMIVGRSDVEEMRAYVVRPSQPKCIFDECKCESDVLIAVLPKSEYDLPNNKINTKWLKDKQTREQQKSHKEVYRYKQVLSEQEEYCDCNDHIEIAGQKSVASQKPVNTFYNRNGKHDSSQRQDFSVKTKAQRAIIVDNNIQKEKNCKNYEKSRVTLSRSDVIGCDCDLDDIKIKRGKSNFEIEYYICDKLNDVRSASVARKVNSAENLGCCMCNNETDFRRKELDRKQQTNYETTQKNIELTDCKSDSDQTGEYNTSANKSDMKTNEKERETSGMTSIKCPQLVEKCCQCNLNGKIERFKSANESNRLKQTKNCPQQRNTTKNSSKKRNFSYKCIKSKHWRVGAENDLGIVPRTGEINARLKSKNNILYCKCYSDNEGEKRNGRYSAYKKKPELQSSLGKSKTHIPKRREKECFSDSEAKVKLRICKRVAKVKLSKTKITKKQNASTKREFNDNATAKQFKSGKAFVSNSKKSKKLSMQPSEKDCTNELYQETGDSLSSDDKCDYLRSDFEKSKQLRSFLSNMKKHKFTSEKYYECDSDNNCQNIKWDFVLNKEIRRSLNKKNKGRRRDEDCECDPKIECDDCGCDFNSYRKFCSSKRGRAKNCQCDPKIECDDCRCDFDFYKGSNVGKKLHTRENEFECNCQDCRCDFDSSKKTRSSSEVEKEKYGRKKDCECDPKIECNDCHCDFNSSKKPRSSSEVEKEKYGRKKDCECDPKIECKDCRCDFDSSKKPRSSSKVEKEKYTRKVDCECDPKIECNDFRCDCDFSKKPRSSSKVEKERYGRKMDCECDPKIDCKDCRCDFDSSKKPRSSSEVVKEKYGRKKDCECDLKMECNDCRCDFDFSKKSCSSTEVMKEKYRRKKKFECDSKIECNDYRCDFDSSKKSLSSSEIENEKHGRKKDCESDRKIECNDCCCDFNSSKKPGSSSEVEKKKYRKKKDCECDLKMECNDCRCDFDSSKKSLSSWEVEKEKHGRKKDCECDPKIECNDCRCEFDSSTKTHSPTELKKEKHRRKKVCECDSKMECDDCQCTFDSYNQPQLTSAEDKEQQSRKKNCQFDSKIECKDCRHGFASFKKPSSSPKTENEIHGMVKDCKYDPKMECDDFQCDFDSHNQSFLPMEIDMDKRNGSKDCILDKNCENIPYNSNLNINNGSSFNMKKENEKQTRNNDFDCKCNLNTNKNPPIMTSIKNTSRTTEINYEYASDSDYKHFRISSGSNKNDRFSKKETYRRCTDCESNRKIVCDNCIRDLGVGNKLHPQSNIAKETHTIEKDGKYRQGNNYKNIQLNSIYNQNSRLPSNMKREKHRRYKYWESESREECEGYKSDSIGGKKNFRTSPNTEKKSRTTQKDYEYDPDSDCKENRNNFHSNRNCRLSPNFKKEKHKREKDWESDSKLECDERRRNFNFNKSCYPHAYMEKGAREIVCKNRRLSSKLEKDKHKKNESESRKKYNEVTCVSSQKSDLNFGKKRERCKCTFKDKTEICICGVNCKCKDEKFSTKKNRVMDEFYEDPDEFPTDQEDIFTEIRKKGVQERWEIESVNTSEMSQICSECDSGESNHLGSYRESEDEDYDKMNRYAYKIRESKQKNLSKPSKKTPKNLSRREMQSEYEKFKILMEAFLAEQKRKSDFSSRREKFKWNSDSECDYQAECVCKVLNFEKFAGTNYSKPDLCSDESQEENERDYKYYHHEDKNQMQIGENLQEDCCKCEEEEVKPQKRRGTAHDRREANLFKTEKYTPPKEKPYEKRRQILKNDCMPRVLQKTKQSANGSFQHKLMDKMRFPKRQKDLVKQTNEEKSQLPCVSYKSYISGLRNTKPVYINCEKGDERVCCICKDDNKQTEANAEYKRRQRSSSQSNQNHRTLGQEKKSRETSLTSRNKSVPNNTKDRHTFTQKNQSTKLVNAEQMQRIPTHRNKERNPIDVDESRRVVRPITQNDTKKRQIPKNKKTEIIKEAGLCSDVCSCRSDIKPANEIRREPTTRGLDTKRRRNHADEPVKKIHSSMHFSNTEKDIECDPKQRNQSEPIDIEIVSKVENEQKKSYSDVETSSGKKNEIASVYIEDEAQTDWNGEKNCDYECLCENNSKKNFVHYKGEQIRWFTHSGMEVNGSEWEFCQCNDSQGCLCDDSCSQSIQIGQQEVEPTNCKCNCVATDSLNDWEEPLFLNDKQDPSVKIHELLSTNEDQQTQIFNTNAENMTIDMTQHGNLDCNNEYEYNVNVNRNATSDKPSVIYGCAQINGRSKKTYGRRRSIFQRLISQTSKKCNLIVHTASASTRVDFTKESLMSCSTRYVCDMQRKRKLNNSNKHKEIRYLESILKNIVNVDNKNNQGEMKEINVNNCSGYEIPLNLPYSMLESKCAIVSTNVEVNLSQKVEANSLEDASKNARSQTNHLKLQGISNGHSISVLPQTKNPKNETQRVENEKAKRFLTVTDIKPKVQERLPSLIKAIRPITVTTKPYNPELHEFLAKSNLPVPPSKNTKIKTCQCFASMPEKVKIATIKKPKSKNIKKKPVFQLKRCKKGVSGCHSNKTPKKEDLQESIASGGSILRKNSVNYSKMNEGNDAVIVVLKNDMYSNLKAQNNACWSRNISGEVPDLQYIKKKMNKMKVLSTKISVELQIKKKDISQNELTVTIPTLIPLNKSQIRKEAKLFETPTLIQKSVEDCRTQYNVNMSETELLVKPKEFLKKCKSWIPSCICTTTNSEVEVEKTVSTKVSDVISNKYSYAIDNNAADFKGKPNPKKSAKLQNQIMAKCQTQKYATSKRPYDVPAKLKDFKNTLNFFNDNLKEVKVLYSPPDNWRASKHSMITTMINCVQAEHEESRKKRPPVQPKPQLKTYVAVPKTTLDTTENHTETVNSPNSYLLL